MKTIKHCTDCRTKDAINSDRCYQCDVAFRVKWDLRMRPRTHLGLETNLSDLVDRIEPTKIAQPAIGDLLNNQPGCNCQFCRLNKEPRK